MPTIISDDDCEGTIKDENKCIKHSSLIISIINTFMIMFLVMMIMNMNYIIKEKVTL